MKYVVIGILLWFALGLVASGFTNAYFQNKYNKCGDIEQHAFATGFALGGPFSLFVAFFHSGYGKYGWSLSFNAC